MYRLLILFIPILFFSCHKEFEPEIIGQEPFLVVEGTIGTMPGTYFVSLTESQSYGENGVPKGISDAIVSVEDNEGNKYTYKNSQGGLYTIVLTEENSAQIDKSYTLHITTKEGDIYKSEPQFIYTCPPISNLFCNYGTDIYLTENSYNQVQEKVVDGLEVYHETKAEKNKSTYFRYTHLAYEQHRSLFSNITNFIILYKHRQLGPGLTTSFSLAENADDYPDNWIRNNLYGFIGKNSLISYNAGTVEGMTLRDTKFQGLIFRLRQHTITLDAFNFYNDLEIQLESDGRLFDPASPQLKGNIKCINDSSKLVLGVFSASDITERYAYFYINSENRIASYDLDGFPELFLDSARITRPDDWILVPF